MSYLTLPESINMLLDAHEPETDATDQQLAAVRAATPSGDYFYADQCGRLISIATSYQIRLHLLCKRLRELAAEEAVEAAAITTVCPVGDQIECPNCGGLGTDRPGTFGSYDLYVDHLCHVCQGEQIVMCICDQGPDPDCVVCTHA